MIYKRSFVLLMLTLAICSYAQSQTGQSVTLKPGVLAPELRLKKILQAPSGASTDPGSDASPQ
jgi:hypothetical protein